MSKSGHQLSMSSRLIRHCRKRYAEGGQPSIEAFKFRENELKQDRPYLSFSWLEKLCNEDEMPASREEAIRKLEECPYLDIRPGDLWIVLSCQRMVDVVFDSLELVLEFSHIPVECNCSHVGVSGYDKLLHCEVAKVLTEEVGIEDTHLISVKRKRCCRS